MTTDMVREPSTDDLDADDTTAMLIRRYHEAKAQRDEWEDYCKRISHVIMGRMDGGRVELDDLVATVRTRANSTTDVSRFVTLVEQAELTHDEWAALLRAATAFKRDLLPEEALELFAAATAVTQSAPWLETRVVRRTAPPKEEAI